jgi:NhaA family Na+:H+ antiporter
VVLPIFAVANAGIPLTSGLGDALSSTVTWGVIVGLVVGKPVGITLFAWLAVRFGIAHMPKAVQIQHIAGVAGLGGIGFTMSLFIAELAFQSDTTAHLARVGVLIGSGVAGTMGYLLLRFTLPPEPSDGHTLTRSEELI